MDLDLKLQVIRFKPAKDQVQMEVAPPRPRWEHSLEPWLMQSVLDHTGDVVLVTEAWPLDRPGPRVVYANEAFARATGYSTEEIIGQSPRILQGPASEPDAIRRMSEALRSWRPVQVELTNYRKDGQPHLVELDIHPVRDPSGWITHWVSVQRDVTMRRATEAKELREDRLQTLSLSAGGVAHDFNNLLVGLLGNLELARLALDRPAEAMALLEEADAAGQQARHLTRQLMDMTREPPADRAIICLCDLVRDAVRFSARGSAVEPSFDFPTSPEEVRVFADRGQLNQLFTNLCINGVEAMKGRGRLQVRIGRAEPEQLPLELDRRRPWWRVDLADEGPGLTPEAAEQAFRPYFSTKSRGSGLGLTVCWMVAHRHEGTIKLRSDGSGTTVTVWLPVPSGGSSGPVLPKASPSSSGPESSGPERKPQEDSGLRLVWMDDEAMVRNVVSRWARRLGLNLFLAERGEQVLDYLGEHPEQRADLVVLDVTVRGGMGGKETLERLRKISQDLPVLLASGYPVLHPDEGADPQLEWISKPFRLDDLTRTVHRLAQRHGPVGPDLTP